MTSTTTVNWQKFTLTSIDESKNTYTKYTNIQIVTKKKVEKLSERKITKISEENCIYKAMKIHVNRRIIKKALKVDNGFISVMGPPQSKKTWVSIAYALVRYIRHQRNCIVLMCVQPLKAHQWQLEKRLGNVIDKVNRLFLIHGYPVLDNCIHTFENTKLKNSNARLYKKRGVWICLTNVSQMVKATKLVKHIQVPVYSVFDEADKTINGEKTSEVLMHLNDDVRLYITATQMDIVLKEPILCSRYFELRPPRGYKGLEGVDFIYYEDVTKRTNGSKMLLLDNYMESKEAYEEYTVKGVVVPNITLVSIHNQIHTQGIIASKIQAYNPMSCIIIFNSGGIDIQYPSVEYLDVPEKECFRGKNRVVIKNRGIGDILRLIRNSMICPKQIYIIAGILADRGITFSETSIKPFWRVNNLLLCISHKLSQPAIIQKAARICTVLQSEDTNPTNIHGRRSVLDALYKSYNLHTELTSVLKNQGELTRDVLNRKIIFKHKVPKKHSLTAKPTVHKPQIIEDPRRRKSKSKDKHYYIVLDHVGEIATKDFEVIKSLLEDRKDEMVPRKDVVNLAAECIGKSPNSINGHFTSIQRNPHLYPHLDKMPDEGKFIYIQKGRQIFLQLRS